MRRDGRRWTAWTCWICFAFVTPGVLLIAIQPLTFPAAALCFAHAWAIPWLQARRGARQVVAIGDPRSVGSVGGRAPDRGPEAVALGLLADLVGHRERELLQRTGLVLQRGELGAWLVGEQGAYLVRGRGRRVDCWCVSVGETNQAPQQRRGSATPRLELPAADRAAHLLLALREDELGFAKVANLGFSGARWRVRRNLGERARIALDEAAQATRASSS